MSLFYHEMDFSMLDRPSLYRVLGINRLNDENELLKLKIKNAQKSKKMEKISNGDYKRYYIKECQKRIKENNKRIEEYEKRINEIRGF